MLPYNYSLCVNRLQSLTKKHSKKDKDLFNSYNNIIKDWPSHGIIEKVLWYDDIENLNFNMLFDTMLATFRFCRVLFDVTSSPFLLNGTLKLHVEKYFNSYPPIFLNF